MLVSIVIRTLNEAKYLEQLLQGIKAQIVNGFNVEIVVIDSGSTDGTLEIAQKYQCVIAHITRDNFSFGRSLNMGCEVASGDVLVFVSGHCVPASSYWLQNLCSPIIQGKVTYTYGKQLGGDETYFSEARIFAKYFPESSRIPQEGFFCNNANSALSREAWLLYKFDEEVTGLEDMELSQRLCVGGGYVGYVADAPVYHYHSETWPQVRRRFEREALALQKIMPHIQVSLGDTVRYIFTSVWRDCCFAKREGILTDNFLKIIRYRFNQYVGSFTGNRQHRQLSKSDKDKYFYPS